jgi:hypothetical protein
MKERPILFSAPMVRALLNGTKTQTRRAIKPQPESEHSGEPYWFVGGYRAWRIRGCTEPNRSGSHNEIECPYGKPGDRLWVREMWDYRGPSKVVGCGVNHGHVIREDPAETYYRADGGLPDSRWRPSIYMPRRHSRITLEITEVRVERLQDISADDAYAEGAAEWAAENAQRLLGEGEKYRSIGQAYKALWQSINGPGSWEANPWVWVVSFKHLEGSNP